MKDRKHHICLIAASFYPVEHISAYRLNSFAKYLDKEKFKITVFCYRHSIEHVVREQVFGANVHRIHSSGLLKKRSQRTTDSKFVHNLKSLNNIVVSWNGKGDFPGWANNVSKEMEKIHKETPIDIILSSYAPMDTHRAALKFKRSNPEVKWIADMRDEMSLNPFISNKERQRARHLELLMAEKIDALITVSEPILNDFRSIMQNDNVKFREIRNGFDHNKEPLVGSNDVFTMLYAGTFYGKNKPNTLFEALRNLKIKEELPSTWKLQLLGTHNNFGVPKELEPHLEFLPRTDNKNAVAQMFKSDCNVLIHPKSIRKGVFSGKLFEYISAEKPILALVDKEDVAAQLIEEQNAGVVTDFYNIEEIEGAVLKIYALWTNKERFPFDSTKVKTLHRCYQVKLLEGLIDEILLNEHKK